MQVEKLIKELPSTHFSPSNTEVVPAEKVSSANANGALNAEVGPNHREDQSILLERIASEMNRLKFYISHAQVFSFILVINSKFYRIIYLFFAIVLYLGFGISFCYIFLLQIFASKFDKN